MNILVIPNRGRSYSAVRPEAECYIALAEKGHNITILTVMTNAYIDEYKKANINIIELANAKKYSLAVIKQIHHLIKKNKIDIVYATESKGIPNAAFACIGTKAKMVAYRGTTGGLYKSDLSNYLCMFHPRINGVVCVSKAVEKYVKPKLKKSIQPYVITIYKGHDIKWYQEPAIDLTTIHSSSEYFNILCIGSSRPQKGLSYLLNAASYLTDLTDLRIILVGDGFDCEPFTQLIKETNMSDRIILTGFRNDVPQIAKASKLLILPSEREGLPRVVLESLASGTPVITSANEGAMEIITDNENGNIVPIGDGKAIAECIRNLYKDSNKLKKFSLAATKTIETKMSHATTVEALELFFKKMLCN